MWFFFLNARESVQAIVWLYINTCVCLSQTLEHAFH